MTDTRSVRRAAEKTARDTLAGTMVGAIGELGVALAAREDTDVMIAKAKTRGDELIDAAKFEAARLISEAEEVAALNSDEYDRAWQSARNAGWTAPQLRAMGYKQPTARGTRDRQRSGTSKQTTPTRRRLDGCESSADGAHVHSTAASLESPSDGHLDVDSNRR